MTVEPRIPPPEGRCPACGREALLIRKPLYEGFRKVGESVSCSACGHAFTAEELPAARKPSQPAVFTEADRTRIADPFAKDERGRLCRYCRHYTVNPFRQWCGLHRRETEATDACPRFEAREASAESGGSKTEEKPPF